MDRAADRPMLQAEIADFDGVAIVHPIAELQFHARLQRKQFIAARQAIFDETRAAGVRHRFAQDHVAIVGPLQPQRFGAGHPSRRVGGQRDRLIGRRPRLHESRRRLHIRRLRIDRRLPENRLGIDPRAVDGRLRISWLLRVARRRLIGRRSGLRGNGPLIGRGGGGPHRARIRHLRWIGRRGAGSADRHRLGRRKCRILGKGSVRRHASRRAQREREDVCFHRGEIEANSAPAE